MTKNPLINALLASAYIVIGVLIMNFASQPLRNKPDTFMAPVVFLSLFTLSVAVMAYLFFYQPLMLFIEGNKKQSVDLFIKTVAIFAVINIFGLVLLSAGIL